MTLNLAFDLQDQIQCRSTVYRLSSQSYVNTRTKIVSNDGKSSWAAYTFMTLCVTHKVEFKVKGRVPDMAQNYVSTPTKIVSNDR